MFHLFFHFDEPYAVTEAQDSGVFKIIRIFRKNVSYLQIKKMNVYIHINSLQKSDSCIYATQFWQYDIIIEKYCG